MLSARVVNSPGGEIEEIHILTTEDIGAKQTVRNVESALKAQLGIEVDHRRISVAQTRALTPAPVSVPEAPPAPGADRLEDRVLFVAHRSEPEPPHRVRMHVQLEWWGRRYGGTASGADLPRARLETAAHATLRAMESAIAESRNEPEPSIALALDGVRVVEAFDRNYALVAVQAIGMREMTRLAGASVVDGTPERAVIMAALQATDRWARGRFDL